MLDILTKLTSSKLFSFVSPIIIFPLIMFLLTGCSEKTKDLSVENNTTTPVNETSETFVKRKVPLQQPHFKGDWINSKKTFSERCNAELINLEEQYRQLQQGSENLLEDFDLLNLNLGDRIREANLLESVHPEQSIRSAAGDCKLKLSKLATNIGLSVPIYEQFAALEAEFDKEEIDKATARYIELTVQDYKDGGVDKPEEIREKIRVINEEIIALGQSFSRVIQEDVRHIEFANLDALKGLPEDYVANHQPNEQGKISISTEYPDYIPFMLYSPDDSLREKLYKAQRSRGYPENKVHLKSLIEKRYQLAQLLDHSTYASLVTKDKMIATPENAEQFIDKVSDLVKDSAQKDYQILLQQLRTHDSDAKKVSPWQKSWLSDQVKQTNYALDSREVRRYFGYGPVRDGIFATVESMFDVKIESWDTPVWHSSVSAHQLIENGKVIGRFYLDMHPRAGKFQHAAQFTLYSGIQDQRIPTAVLVCNFPGGNDPMERIGHGQVETFLHEFGHLIHGLFGGHQPWSRISGIATEWDFVEAPAQMLEEWIWDYDVLKTFAISESGETIPLELVEQMRKARSFSRGLDAKIQMYYAALSLNYYQRIPNSFELDELMQEIESKYSVFEPVEGTHFYANFGHLDGYSAIYYTYMWSQVIAADMLTAFKQEGLLSSNLAKRYREKVLAPGGLKPAAELVEDFLGRPYQFDAFAESLAESHKPESVGIIKPKESES